MFLLLLVGFLQAHDRGEQRKEESCHAGSLDQERQPPDYGREQHHELELVGQQQREQEFFVLVLQVELLLLLEASLRIGVVIVVIFQRGRYLCGWHESKAEKKEEKKGTEEMVINYATFEV